MSAGFKKNRFVDVRPSAAGLRPRDEAIDAQLRRTSHDGQGSVSEVRKVFSFYFSTSTAPEHQIYWCWVSSCDILPSYFPLQTVKTEENDENAKGKVTE